MRLISYKQPAIAPWSSFDRLSSLRDLLDSAFQLAGPASTFGADRGWSPALDIYEDADHLTVRLEAAGLKKEDFDISLHDDNLTVSGERRAEKSAGEGESFRSERFFGQFSRTITLPAAVNADGVKATYTDGVLTVTLPKAEEAKPRKIAVDIK